MKIALIDSIVETAALRATQIDLVAIKKEAKKGRRENPLPSHGTLCAKILDAYVGEYPTFSKTAVLRSMVRQSSVQLNSGNNGKTR